MLTLSMMFIAVSNTVGLPQGLQSALCFQESRHKVEAVNTKESKGGHSHGVCQIQYNSAKLMGYKGDVSGLYNPIVNIYYSAKYLKYQLKRYDNDYIKAISAYNSGTYYADKNQRPVNQKYVTKVFKYWSERR